MRRWRKPCLLLLAVALLFGTVTPAVSPVMAEPVKIAALDLTKTETFLKNDAAGKQVKVTGITGDGASVDLTGNPGIQYHSSDAYILTVDPSGTIVIGSPEASGFATVTATYTNDDRTTAQSKIMVVVYEDRSSFEGFEAMTEPPTSGSYKFADESTPRDNILFNNTHYRKNTANPRTGNNAVDIRIANTSWPSPKFADYDEGNPATWPSTVAQYGADLYSGVSTNDSVAAGRMYPSAIAQGWFYDSGEKTNAKAAVYFQANEKNNKNESMAQCLNVWIGVGDDSKNHYTFRNREMNRAKIGPGGTSGLTDGYLGNLIIDKNVEMNGQPVTVSGGTGENRTTREYTFPKMERSKGWHQVVAVLDGGDSSDENVATDKGTLSYYLDGTLVAVEDYVVNSLHVVRASAWGEKNTGYFSTYDDFSTSFYYKSKHPPIIKELTVTGRTMAGETLTAAATAESINGAALEPVTYQWYRSDDGSSWSPIQGAAAATLPLTGNDVGFYFRVGATAHASSAPVDGVETYSETLGPVAPVQAPPSAANPAITGTPAVGSTLTLTYDYSGASAQGDSIFLWEAERTTGVWTAVGSARTYRVAYEDAGKKIRASVTPVDVTGAAGETVTTPVQTVSSDIPSLSLFVATDGSDETGDGSIERPYASFEKAKEEVARNKGGSVTVYFRGGEYPISKSIRFTAADSGSAAMPVTYKAYEGEKVVLTGSQKLDASKITRVTDEAVLNRLVDPAAKKRLYQIKLSDVGVTSLRPLQDYYGWWGNVFLPDEIYYNNTALEMARYPNKEHNYAYLYTKEVTAPEERDGPNGWRETPFSIVYQDDGDRARLWQLEGKVDLFISGVYGQDFAFMTNRIDTAKFDPVKKEFTSVTGSKGGYRVQTDHRFFFMNLLEEIDFPGEYYLDRDSMTLYFYPPDVSEETAAADLRMTVLDNPMLDLSGVEYVNFEGLTFDKTRNVAVKGTDLNHITFNGCTISRTGMEGMNLSGKNITVSNSHIYDLGAGGLFLTGNAADRKTLVPDNNRIINNRIHDVNRLSGAVSGYVPGLRVTDSNGVTIEHNELYNSKMMHVWFERSNDIDFNYNHFYYAALDGGDMGALYWGRDISTMGIRIKYNYFHDIGNTYTGGDWGNLGVQSIFWDDSSVGPELVGNIFYKGGCGQGFTVKTNNGQWSLAQNNILVDSKIGFQYQMRSGMAPGTKQKDWFDAVQTDPNILPTYTQNVDISSPAWAERYKDTIWAPLTNFKTLFAPDGPADTNKNSGNLFVNITTPFNGGDKNPGCVQSNNWATDTDPGFVAYGKDFKLTASGLAAVQAKISGFENIPTEQIGAQPYELDGQTKYVGGRAPSASNAVINKAGQNLLDVSYTFTDPDGDAESNTQVRWYVSDSQNGTYSLLPGKRTILFTDASLLNKWVKAEVIPFDQNKQEGEPVFSAPVLVDNVRPDPSEALAAAEALLRDTETGSGLGQVPVTDYNALQDKYDALKTLSGNPDADGSLLSGGIDALKQAITAFQAAVITEITVTENNQTVIVPESSLSLRIKLAQGVTGTRVQTPNTMPELTVEGYLPIDGTSRRITLKIQQGTKLSGDGWDGVLSLFPVSSSPSAAVANAEQVNVILIDAGLAGSQSTGLTASKPVRVEIEGVSAKECGAVINKKFQACKTALAEDSFTQANQKLKPSLPQGRVNTASNLVWYTLSPGELVVYTKAETKTPEPAPTYYPTQNPDIGTSGPGFVSGPGNPVGIGTGKPDNTPQTAVFADTAGHWAQTDIEKMYHKGIVSGVTATTFEPDRAITRAEFAALAVRALELTDHTPAGFSDIPEGDWYAPSVNAAANAGLITGYGGFFRPDDRITREEMAVVLAKAYQFRGGEATGGSIHKFSDIAQISEWAADAVDLTTSAGLIAGMTTDTFAPQEYATRAQAAAILSRLLDI